MRLVAYFDDKAGMIEHRQAHEPAHLAYLKANRSEILIAGGLRPEPNDKFVGDLWVMDVESFERAKELIKNDPYYAPELRSYKLLVWGKAIDEPVVL
ncbi:MAG: YciI family protein [Marinomonas colpomeniae]